MTRRVLLSLTMAAAMVTSACQEKKESQSNEALNEADNPQPQCLEPELVLFDNMNAGAVLNGGRAPEFDTRTFDPHPGQPPGTSLKTRRYCLIRIETYHWNNGNGAPPGKLGLTDANGQPVAPGPWQATGSPGQGGVANANWSATATAPPPGIVLIHGRYTVTDSSPNTWSGNAQAGRAFARVIVKEYGEGT